MFDIAWSELGIIAVVALVVIGPRDLPKVLRTVGQWTAKARAMAREFQSGIDDMVREAELDELRKAAKQVSDFSLEKEVKKTIDPDGSLEKSFQETTKIDDPFAEPQPVMEPPAEEKAAEATTAAEVPADVAAAPVPAKDETKS
ncbi:Sec-independent protein translocase protein TatB [uncultured Ferrovibrio sp.]|jgi:sec-independent protein translocase protein TatB|uniref:Sec-independent protein translocase protein TatB n=1 Tax=uncultured Ferrovibrio sp. TaxID=1576913 RepID=UPI002626A074|nr:Sec-independent protein translocase protein TatB [uncultured Ferrovibrio sp.]